MPTQYSKDFRWRIVFQHCFRGRSVRKVARDNYVSKSTIGRIVKLYKSSGDVISEQYKHGPLPRLSSQDQLAVLNLFLENPGVYLREMQQKVYATTGIWVSCATLCRTAKRLGLTRQKMRNISLRRSDIARGAYMADISVFDPEMLVFVDETGSERKNSICRYGYGLRGMTPVQHQLFVYGKRISAIGVLSTRGIEDAYIV